jgi:hypothetical protein
MKTKIQNRATQWLALGIPAIERAETAIYGFAIFYRDESGKLLAEKYACEKEQAKEIAGALNAFWEWRTRFNGGPRQCIIEAEKHGHYFDTIKTTPDGEEKSWVALSSAGLSFNWSDVKWLDADETRRRHRIHVQWGIALRETFAVELYDVLSGMFAEGEAPHKANLDRVKREITLVEGAII